MAQPLLYRELTLSGDGVSAGQYAEVPQVLLGQFDEFTVYVQFGAGTTAGRLQIKSAFRWPAAGGGGVQNGNFEPDLANLAWASVGSTFDWAAPSSQKVASVTGVFSALRVYIETTVAGGSVRVGIVCASKN